MIKDFSEESIWIKFLELPCSKQYKLHEKQIIKIYFDFSFQQ